MHLHSLSLLFVDDVLTAVDLSVQIAVGNDALSCWSERACQLCQRP